MSTRNHIDSFVHSKVSQWSLELETLTEFAKLQLHAAYAALTHGCFLIGRIS